MHFHPSDPYGHTQNICIVKVVVFFFFKIFFPVILNAAVTALKGNRIFPFHSAYHCVFSYLKGHYIKPGLAHITLQNVKNA